MSSPLSGGRLGYWTACNNFKRYSTLPNCGLENSKCHMLESLCCFHLCHIHSIRKTRIKKTSGMKMLSALQAYCEEFLPMHPNGKCDVFLLLAWTNYTTNCRVIGDLRRRGAHMTSLQWIPGHLCECKHKDVEKKFHEHGLLSCYCRI